MAHADPWRFAFSLPLAGRILCLPSVLAPGIGERLATITYKAAEYADDLGFEGVAIRATGLVFGMEYFRGLRQEAGSLRGVLSRCAEFLAKAAISDRPVAGVPAWLARGVRAITRDERQGSSGV
jgi:hypothetical protein